uniref:Cytochrome P450 n=1 Tax=Kalanchoe fedtschenkoi TaxID=63787 RepID=A0A7N0VBN2_KALFE
MVEESHLPKLHYLNAVLKETHRLHPGLPLLIPRRPSETTDLYGYTIPQGTKIFINVWAIHRDAQLWDRPERFRPERFLDHAAKWDYAGSDFRYLPFGSGRRVCAGLPLAERMQMYTLASFLHCFKWDVSKGEEIELSETFGIVLKKAVPLVAVPTPRLSDFKLYAKAD